MRFDQMPPLTQAQRRLVEDNLGLVGSFVNRAHQGQHNDDAFQDGVMGLMRAAQLFNPALGWRFSTYAMGWIRAGVQHGMLNREGVNFRRAHANGELHEHPASLDVEYDDGGAVITLPDSGPLPDDVGVDRARIGEARRAGERACRDEIDRAIVDALFSDVHLNLRRLDLAVAAQMGRSCQGISNRRRRLQLVMVAAVDRCAA